MKTAISVSCTAALAILLCAPASAQEDAFDNDSAEVADIEAVADTDDDADLEAPAEESLALEIDDLPADPTEAPDETAPEDVGDEETDPADPVEEAEEEEAPIVEETVVVEVPANEAAPEDAGDEAATDEEPAPAEEVAAEPEPAAPILATEEGEPLVSMAFEQSTLEDVVAAFRTQTGANIVNGWTNQFTQLVSVRLDDVPWRQGLSSILVPFNLQLREEPRGSHIYIVAEPRRTAPPRFTETFELKHLEAPEVARLFAGILPKDCLVYGEPSANVVIVKATDEQISECKSVLAKIDKPSPQVYIDARFIGLTASASKKLGLKWNSLDEFGVSLSRLGGGFSTTDAHLATFGIKADSRVISGATTDSSTSESSSSSGRNSSGWNGGERETSFSSARSSSKSRITTRDAATMFSSGRYRTTANTTISDDSVSMTVNDSPLANLTANDLGWHHTAGFGGQLSMSEFELVMSAFEQIQGVQTFSSPMIIVRNGKKAVVDMTTKYPNVKIDYQQSTESGQRDSISSSLSTIPGKNIPWVGEAFFSYGITLEVTPTVSPDGLITIEIVPTISSLDRMKTVYVTSDSSIGNEYPVISIQKTETKFTLEDGKTAVIGGLSTTNEKTIDSGIPLLRHIPWIGPRLFGWKSREKEQIETLIFVSVHIADPVENDGSYMPKNFVLGKMLQDGRIKEPGDRTEEEMWDLESKPIGYSIP